MTFVIVIGAWIVGSLPLGLLLGSLFRSSDRRRDADENLFRRVEALRVVAGGCSLSFFS